MNFRCCFNLSYSLFLSLALARSLEMMVNTASLGNLAFGEYTLFLVWILSSGP